MCAKVAAQQGTAVVIGVGFEVFASLIHGLQPKGNNSLVRQQEFVFLEQLTSSSNRGQSMIICLAALDPGSVAKGFCLD
jgi:hypothetical protein